MNDSGERLLKWIVSCDPLERVVLSCDHVEPPSVGREELSVRARELTEFSIGLPLQLLACGVQHVEYVPCPQEPPVPASAWECLAPAHIGVYSPRRHIRHGETLRWEGIPIPRRSVFGFRDSAPIDIHSDDQDRTVEALGVLAGRGIVAGEMGDLGAAAGVHLAAHGCTACRVCVSGCPEGALSLSQVTASDRTTTSTLHHSLQKCRGCQACVRLCPVQALSIAGPISFAEALSGQHEVLAGVATRVCTKCGAVHPAEEGDLCQLCRYRENDPFSAVLPPELARRLPPDLAERLMRGK